MLQMEVQRGVGVAVQAPDELPLAATTCGLGKAGIMHLVRFPSPLQALEAGIMHPHWLRGLNWCLSMQLTQQIPLVLPRPTPPIMHQVTVKLYATFLPCKPRSHLPENFKTLFPFDPYATLPLVASNQWLLSQRRN